MVYSGAFLGDDKIVNGCWCLNFNVCNVFSTSSFSMDSKLDINRYYRLNRKDATCDRLNYFATSNRTVMFDRKGIGKAFCLWERGILVGFLFLLFLSTRCSSNVVLNCSGQGPFPT